MDRKFILMCTALSLLSASTNPLGQAADTTVTHKVYVDIGIGDSSEGRIVIGLFGRIAPKTVANYLAFIKGHEGKSYKGVTFHRIIKGFMMQGGDFVMGDGTGYTSIYDGGYFDDEPFLLKHIGAGWVSMANAGPNTNGIQWVIHFVPAPWLDGAHVVFGRVLSGMPVVRRIEQVETGQNDRPLRDVVVRDCGELPVSPEEQLLVEQVEAPEGV